MKMPEPDADLLRRKDEIAAALARLVPGAVVVADLDRLRAYESDALTAYRQTPMAVVLPGNTEEVAKVLAWCAANKVKVVPRGSGTSLSGGALPLADSVVVGLSRLSRILEIDYDNRVVVAQPGVTNLAITQAVQARGFF